MLDFSCYADDRSLSLEKVYSAGEKKVEEIAQTHKLEMQHAYSWPDGSMYKYLRTQNPDDLKLFNTETTLKAKGKDVRVIIRCKVTEEDEKKVSHNELVSLEERFTKNREELHQLHLNRNEEREKLQQPYKDHRQNCPKCPKPTGLCCEDGLEVLKACEANQKAYVESL